MEEIRRMQKNLLLIRRTLGWTAEELGKKIGVTRQTINNIEAGRSNLTKTQYIAIRSVIDAEIVQNPDDTEMLRSLLEILVDHPEKFKIEEQDQLISKAELVAPSILAGAATREEVSKEWMKTATALGVATSIASSHIITLGLIPTGTMSMMTGAWLLNMVDKSSRGKKRK